MGSLSRRHAEIDLGWGMQARLDHLVLWVKDRTRALDFYETVLGFECANNYREEGGLFPSVRINPNTILDLFPKNAAILARIVARERKLSGAGKPINHVCFSVDRSDYDALKARLEKAGVKTSKENTTQIGAQGKCSGSIYFQDPDANVIQVMVYDEGSEG
jgi:catechol 2,3-dioxygenase-like lactoylglutathione lyase family enzyme